MLDVDVTWTRRCQEAASKMATCQLGRQIRVDSKPSCDMGSAERGIGAPQNFGRSLFGNNEVKKIGGSHASGVKFVNGPGSLEH